MEYSEKVIDHFMHPRNVGEIEDASCSGTVGNPVCGDIMKIDLKIEDGIVKDAKFKTFGCGSAIATSSMATEMIIGKPVDEVLQITNKVVADSLDGLPPIKMHCSVLAEQAVKAALKQYFEERGEMTPEREKYFKVLDEEEQTHIKSAYQHREEANARFQKLQEQFQAQH